MRGKLLSVKLNDFQSMVLTSTCVTAKGAKML